MSESLNLLRDRVQKIDAAPAIPQQPRTGADLDARVAALEEALRPFAAFGARLLDGRRQVPKSGPWHGLDSGAATEANIEIEDFTRAMQVLGLERNQRGVT